MTLCLVAEVDVSGEAGRGLGLVGRHPGVDGRRVEPEVPLKLEGGDVLVVETEVAVDDGRGLSPVLNHLRGPHVQDLDRPHLSDGVDGS